MQTLFACAVGYVNSGDVLRACVCSVRHILANVAFVKYAIMVGPAAPSSSRSGK